MTQSFALTKAGELALARAQAWWASNIFDPKRNDDSPQAKTSRAAIDEMLADCGWTWEIPYKGDGQVEWCGIFAGSCWRSAGLDPTWLATFFASTLRLEAWANYRPWNQTKNPPPARAEDRRLVASYGPTSTKLAFAILPGDIVIVGDGTPAAGDHITIAESWDEKAGAVHTISGNGVGVGPKGNNMQGVVRKAFKLGGGNNYCIRRVYRPGFSDLLAERPPLAA